MPLPKVVTRINRRVFNPVLRHLVGAGPFAEVQHRGRRSGRAFRTPILAFRDGGIVTIALTYGPDVDWLKNVRAGGGCRLRFKGEVLTLGAPVVLDPGEGLRRMPVLPRLVLPVTGCRDFIELPVLAS